MPRMGHEEAGNLQEGEAPLPPSVFLSSTAELGRSLQLSRTCGVQAPGSGLSPARRCHPLTSRTPPALPRTGAGPATERLTCAPHVLVWTQSHLPFHAARRNNVIQGAPDGWGGTEGTNHRKMSEQTDSLFPVRISASHVFSSPNAFSNFLKTLSVYQYRRIN